MQIKCLMIKTMYIYIELLVSSLCVCVFFLNLFKPITTNIIHSHRDLYKIDRYKASTGTPQKVHVTLLTWNPILKRHFCSRQCPVKTSAICLNFVLLKRSLRATFGCGPLITNNLVVSCLHGKLDKFYLFIFNLCTHQVHYVILSEHFITLLLHADLIVKWRLVNCDINPYMGLILLYGCYMIIFFVTFTQIKQLM